ncbi:MAG: dTDP-4-dehydrorhamnose 3,5-epimerase family protein [Actinomycetota bacterium]
MSPLSDISGILLHDLTTFTDERGAFTETFRQEWLPDGEPAVVQSNLSRSRAGVVRGMHFHRSQRDWWVVLEGVAFVALCDLRSGSRRGTVATELFDDGAGLTAISIPPGVAHGFCAVSDVALQYMVTAYHDGSDELGFAWDDPDAAIPWPVAQPIVSDRDRTSPHLARVLEALDEG